MKRKFALSTLAVAVGFITVNSARAAESLDTVIVTAGKMEADVQQTALSIQSFSDEKLAEVGATSLVDIAKFTPGLQLDQGGGGLTATVRVRGIGTPSFSALDPSVPIFIDGVAQGRTGSGFQDLLDVARVEVLRGPQGTLYGRNSTAGAINVWTKDASTREWEGSVQGQLGNYNDREFKGTVNVPMVDDLLGGRFSAFSTKQDGYIDNEITDKTGGGYADRFGGRAKILLTPLDDISVQWTSDYSKSINHPVNMVKTYAKKMSDYAAGGVVTNPSYPAGTELQGNLPVPDPYGGETYQSNSWTEDVNVAHSLTVNWDIAEGFLADHTFTSISAYQKYTAEQDLDKDSTALEWARTLGKANTRNWSQEFRLSSDAGEKWEYVGGLFYYAELVQSDQENNNRYVDQLAALNRPGVFPAFPANRASDSNSHSNLRQDNGALFGQVTYNFTDDFSVTAGLRQSYVKKYGNSDVDVIVRLGAPANQTRPPANQILIDHVTQTEHDTSGVLKARYFLDADIMLYASYDRGFKPGGFNRLVAQNAGDPVTYKKENSNNFEIGAKTQWLNNRLQANISLFHLDFINYHNQVTDPSTSNIIVENIKSVTSDGVELDLQGLLRDDLTAGLSFAYLNPRVSDDSIPASQDGQAPVRPGRSQNLHDGQLINDVSQYSANIFAEYTYPMLSAEGFVRADAGYRSRYLLSGQGLYYSGGTLYQGGYTTTNLRFGVRKFAEHWQFAGWIKNLTDKEYASGGSVGFGNQPDGTTINPGAPRTYGVVVQYDY